MEYGLFETRLAELHEVEEADLKAFRAKLRFFRYQGIPEVDQPGKGKRLSYTDDDFWTAHLALYLDEAGYGPRTIKSIIAAALADKHLIAEFEAKGDDAYFYFGMKVVDREQVVGFSMINNRLAGDSIIFNPKPSFAAVYSVLNISHLTRETRLGFSR